MIETHRLRLQAGLFVVGGIDLHVERGEYFVLMGATGSGKSLLVKCLCGLVRPTWGAVRIGGRDVTGLEPRLRRVGYMPQDCLLFPHLSVRQNVEFSLRARHVRRKRRREIVEPLVEMLDIDYLLDRRPRHLSGGERQKAALARALAAEPQVLLLDEPVSALDEPTRREACRMLRDVQRRLGIATVHVCHSLEEARAVADRVGVLHDGELHQVGTVEQLCDAPATPAVARLMNVPAP